MILLIHQVIQLQTMSMSPTVTFRSTPRRCAVEHGRLTGMIETTRSSIFSMSASFAPSNTSSDRNAVTQVAAKLD